MGRGVFVLVCAAAAVSAVGVGSRHGSFKAAPPHRGSTKLSAKGGVKMVFVPAGRFTMGSNGVRRDETPKRKIYLDGFWIGKNDVTVAQFRAYCDATRYKYDWDALKPDWGWRNDNPMVNVTWDEARGFCRWAGGDLPTEAQWEKAARSNDGRIYPWGNPFRPWYLWWSKDGKVGGAGSTLSVGRYPKGASPYGCLDMAGNVWQWCLDWYDPTGYDPGDTRNPKGPPGGKLRVLRGGGWRGYGPDFFRCSARSSYDPSKRAGDYGFRLALRR